MAVVRRSSCKSCATLSTSGSVTSAFCVVMFYAVVSATGNVMSVFLVVTASVFMSGFVVLHLVEVSIVECNVVD